MVLPRCLLPVLAGGLLWAAQLGAQESTGVIAGRVLDSASQAGLPGMRVNVVGTDLNALTRDDGRYTLLGVPAGAQTVRVSRIGYVAQSKPVTVAAGQPVELDFVMAPSAVTLSEMVIVGYGTQRRAAVTGSVAQVDATQANVGVQTNVNNLIQGRATGVTVIQNSGEPGAGAQIRVRGGTSITASNEPLYVIDGVPIQNTQTEGGGLSPADAANPPESAALPRSPLNLLNPSDIASVTILKDAAATAIYGSRGANGVVLIETKKGQAGTTTMEYDGYYAMSTPSERLDLLNGNEYRTFVQGQVDLYVQDSLAGVVTDQRRGLNPSRLDNTLFVTDADGDGDLDTLRVNTDWEDAVTRNAVTQNHNFAFSGGTQAAQYRASLNYMDQEGVVLNNGFVRYQGRLNGTTRLLSDKLQLGLNLTASQARNKYLAYENQGGFEGGVFANMVTFNPTRPVTFRDPVTGQNRFFEIPGQQSIRNPVAIAEQINDRGTTTRTLGNLTASYALLPSLTVSTNVGVDRSSGLRQTYFPAANPIGSSFNGRARQSNRNVSTATIQTLLTYNGQLGGDQTLEAVGGYEYSDTDIQEFGTEVRDFVTDAFEFNNLGAGATLVVPFSLEEPRRLASLFTRVNYGFKDRYFLTGVVRRDGSSVFGANNKYAVFPAISGSWRLSQESFMAEGPFSELRLRVGYGLQGNQAIVPFQSLPLLGASNDARYPIGGTLITGITPSQNANPDLKWETTAQTNVAVDYGLLDDRFTGSLEYYVKNTRDLLLRVDVPQPAPVGNQIRNVGKVRNRGFEASLDAQLWNQPSRTWSAGLVFSAENNEVVDLGNFEFISTGNVSGQGQSGQRSQRIIPGQPLGTFWGPVFVGVDAEGHQLFRCTPTASRTDCDPATGRTTKPTSDDDTILGDANPDWTLGLRSQATWGRFDGSFLIRSVRGGNIFNNTALVYATKGNALQDRNFLKSALNDGIGLHEPAIFSSRYIEDGSFLRLQNITVGYTVPLRGGAGQARTARIYVSGDNLLLFSDYSGYDPEVYTDASVDGYATRGADYLVYPRARTFTAGIRLGF